MTNKKEVGVTFSGRVYPAIKSEMDVLVKKNIIKTIRKKNL